MRLDFFDLVLCSIYPTKLTREACANRWAKDIDPKCSSCPDGRRRAKNLKIAKKPKNTWQIPQWMRDGKKVHHKQNH